MTPPTPPAGDLIVGIDLGTTNSLAAVMGRKGPLVLRDADGEALVPSVVCFAPDGVLVGRAAQARALDLPERTVHSIKRLIGQAGPGLSAELARLPYPVELGERGLPRVRVDGQRYSPEEISARILAAVKGLAEAALGTPVRKAVVTVPAYFDDAQRLATKDAAALAGLDCLRIVNEPTAASLAFGIDGSKDGLVLVYDLGGGTFDVSILRIDDGIFRVLATNGDTHLGGDDFDALIVARMQTALTAFGVDAAAVTNPHARQAMRRAAARLKHQISLDEHATLDLELGALGTFPFTLSRTEFESDIAPLVQRTLDRCRAALTDAGVAAAALDHVLLVGGSTRVPLVRQRLQELLRREPRSDVDPDLAVALGAAVQADILAGGTRHALLLDVVPLSLGLETMGGAMSKLILRNSTVPASATETFSTQADNQTGVELNIYQGERELVRDCRHLGSFKLSGIPPMPAGLPRIAVTFLVDADGLLTVRAVEERTGQTATTRVVPSFGLTRDEVRRLMQDSIEHAEADMQARAHIEVRNKAKAMVRGTTRALAMADLPPDQTWSVQRATQRLAGLLEAAADTAALSAGVEELSRLTAQIADDVISSAVRNALAGGGDP